MLGFYKVHQCYSSMHNGAQKNKPMSKWLLDNNVTVRVAREFTGLKIPQRIGGRL